MRCLMCPRKRTTSRHPRHRRAWSSTRWCPRIAALFIDELCGDTVGVAACLVCQLFAQSSSFHHVVNCGITKRVAVLGRCCHCWTGRKGTPGRQLTGHGWQIARKAACTYPKNVPFCSAPDFRDQANSKTAHLVDRAMLATQLNLKGKRNFRTRSVAFFLSKPSLDSATI